MERLVLVAAALFVLASAAFAQGHSHTDKKGPHGGPNQDVVGIRAELILSERTITIHVYDEAGKPVAVAGYSGSTLVGTGQARQVVQPGAWRGQHTVGSGGQSDSAWSDGHVAAAGVRREKRPGKVLRQAVG